MAHTLVARAPPQCRGSRLPSGRLLPSLPHQAARFARVSVCTGVGVARGRVQGTGRHQDEEACDGLEAAVLPVVRLRSLTRRSASERAQ